MRKAENWRHRGCRLALAGGENGGIGGAVGDMPRSQLAAASCESERRTSAKWRNPQKAHQLASACSGSVASMAQRGRIGVSWRSSRIS